MINYVVLRPGFNFWMQEHLWSQPREKRAVEGSCISFTYHHRGGRREEAGRYRLLAGWAPAPTVGLSPPPACLMPSGPKQLTQLSCNSMSLAPALPRASAGGAGTPAAQHQHINNCRTTEHFLADAICSCQVALTSSY